MSLLSVPINDRSILMLCFKLHSNFHEYLWSQDAGKATIGNTALHKLPIYYEYTCLLVSRFFGMICCLFSKHNKTTT